ncbi:cell envelope integrity protein CreD [Flavobacterium sp. CJ74]|uniref:cell envelope integrity protein CreD n=1 Tax=Flavobacterium psychrotrophum TaxID=2294119 RepID=UPI000E3248B7
METFNKQPQPAHYPEHQNNNSFMQSTTVRVIMVGVLTLVLLLPLQYVKSLIWERQELQQNVSAEIAGQWGGNVFVYGPILKVPYQIITETETIDKATKVVTISKQASITYAYFFPDALNVDANVTTETKKRNNYETTVFSSKMKLSGNYPTPDFSKAKIPTENILWDEARIIMNAGSLKSIKGAVNITFNGKTYDFEPVIKESNQNGNSTSWLETSPVNLAGLTGKPTSYKMDINYDGSEKISIVPIGKITEATIKSNWADPKFDGNFLPYTKTITDDSFAASWKVSHLNRAFVQQYFGSLPDLGQFTFDTNFIILNDEYQQNERAAKYGFLVIGLTFLVFFLIQMMSKISIHIFQYGMVGLALIMFYTLLIAITEHSSFTLAYLLSGSAVIIMIGLYSVSILRNKKFPIFITTALTALYTFIYVIIQLEDYALLAGSLGLFAILGAVMYFSRKIDWENTASANQ